MTRQELIERLEKAEGADRELDCWLGYHADLTVDEMPWREKIDRFGIDHALNAAKSNQNIWSSALSPYTASIDAAVGLVATSLPGWYWRTGQTSLFPNGWALVSRHHPDHCTERDEAGSSDGKAATPAIALCISVLKALEAQEAP